MKKCILTATIALAIGSIPASANAGRPYYGSYYFAQSIKNCHSDDMAALVKYLRSWTGDRWFTGAC